MDDILKVLQRVLASGHSAAAAAVINYPDEDTYIPLLCACGRTNRIKSAFLILKVSGSDSFLSLYVACCNNTLSSSSKIDLGWWVGYL